MTMRVDHGRRSGNGAAGRLHVEPLEARALMAVVVGAPDLLPASDSGISSRDNRTNVAAPTFAIQAPRAEGVALFRVGDSEPLGTGVPGPKPGIWLVTSRALPDGVHVIRAQATGGVHRSAPLRVEIRTAAPVPVTLDLCRCTDSGVKGDRITNAVAPRFVGTAPAGAVVSLGIEGGASLGSVRADARGAWALAARRPLVPEGHHLVRATTTDIFGNQSAAGSVAITIDRSRPTVAIEVTGIDSFRAIFSKPVTGFTSALRGMTFSGQPVGAQRIALPFSSPQLRQWVGPIVFVPSADGRVYDVSFPDFGPPSGSYTLRLLARASGVVDAAAGNPLAGDASVTFSID